MLHNNYYFYHYNSLAQKNWEVALLKMMCKLLFPSCKANVNLDYPCGTLFAGFPILLSQSFCVTCQKGVFITPLEVLFLFFYLFILLNFHLGCTNVVLPLHFRGAEDAELQLNIILKQRF